MCDARQYSDQMQCGACGLTWDVNDPDPPACAPVDYGRLKLNQTEQENIELGRKSLKRLLALFD